MLAKEYSTKRATRLAAQGTDWFTDPRDPQRQVGLVPVPADDYQAGQYRRPITRVAVRCRLPNDHWGVGGVICTLPLADALTVSGQDPARATDPHARVLAYVSLDDQRGGGVETTFKEDKQGLGITKGSKKRFAAQQVVAALGALSHNVLGSELVWAKRWLHDQLPGLARFGVKRLVREIFGIGGQVALDAHGRVTHIILNQANRLSHWLLAAIQALASSADGAVTLGET